MFTKLCLETKVKWDISLCEVGRKRNDVDIDLMGFRAVLCTQWSFHVFVKSMPSIWCNAQTIKAFCKDDSVDDDNVDDIDDNVDDDDDNVDGIDDNVVDDNDDGIDGNDDDDNIDDDNDDGIDDNEDNDDDDDDDDNDDGGDGGYGFIA